MRLSYLYNGNSYTRKKNQILKQKPRGLLLFLHFLPFSAGVAVAMGNLPLHSFPQIVTILRRGRHHYSMLSFEWLCQHLLLAWLDVYRDWDSQIYLRMVILTNIVNINLVNLFPVFIQLLALIEKKYVLKHTVPFLLLKLRRTIHVHLMNYYWLCFQLSKFIHRFLL